MSSGQIGDERSVKPDVAETEVVASLTEQSVGEVKEIPVEITPEDVLASGDEHQPSDTTPPDTADTADVEVLRALSERMEHLTRSVEEANRLSQERERIIDRLHQENQELRQGELQQAMLPIFRDLVRLHDDLRQTSLSYPARTQCSPQEVARDFECLAEMVSDILYRQGVERYESREGEPFNPKEHRVLSAVATHEQSRDRTVARIVRDGFRSDSRIIRLLEAEVYRYAPATPARAEEGEEAGSRPAADPQ